MSRNYKFHNPEGVYFVSFAVIRWMKVFIRNKYKDILLDSLRYCQKNKGMEIFAWCIMPSHVHLVFRASGHQRPEQVLGDFKRFTSRKLVDAIGTQTDDDDDDDGDDDDEKQRMLHAFRQAGAKSSNTTKHQFWRHDNHPIELWSAKVIDQKINYVHQNPVVAGLVYRAEDYLYSSARDYADEQGCLEGVIVVRKWAY